MSRFILHHCTPHNIKMDFNVIAWNNNSWKRKSLVHSFALVYITQLMLDIIKISGRFLNYLFVFDQTVHFKKKNYRNLYIYFQTCWVYTLKAHLNKIKCIQLLVVNLCFNSGFVIYHSYFLLKAVLQCQK